MIIFIWLIIILKAMYKMSHACSFHCDMRFVIVTAIWSWQFKNGNNIDFMINAKDNSANDKNINENSKFLEIDVKWEWWTFWFKINFNYNY